MLVFDVPLDWLAVHTLKDRWIIVRFETRHRSPEDDRLVLFHENQFLTIDEPFLWGIEIVENVIESLLCSGNQIVISQRLRKTDSQSPLNSPNPGLRSSFSVG